MQLVTSRSVVAVAAAIFAAAAGSQAWAGVAFGNLTPAGFISSCQQMGGKSERAGTGTIKCTLPSGTVVTCSFDSGGSICVWKEDLPQTAQRQLLGDPAANSVNPNIGGGKTPKAPGTGGSSTVN